MTLLSIRAPSLVFSDPHHPPVLGSQAATSTITLINHPAVAPAPHTPRKRPSTTPKPPSAGIHNPRQRPQHQPTEQRPQGRELLVNLSKAIKRVLAVFHATMINSGKIATNRKRASRRFRNCLGREYWAESEKIEPDR